MDAPFESALLFFTEGVIGDMEKLDMRKFSSILIAAALGASSLSSLTILAFAADQGDSVKTARPPFKPGREIDGNVSPAPSRLDDRQAAKSGRAPYKPGRALDEDAAAQGGASSNDGEQPVKHAGPPYKPGRQADDQ